MFKTYLKSAFRNLLLNKVQSAISILGLGIGLGSIILLTALIVHERSFEKCIPGYRNVYKVTLGDNCRSAFPLGEQMKNDLPEVKDYFRIFQAYNLQIRTLKNQSGRTDAFAFADSTIFRILGISFIEGGPATARSEVAISARMAGKFFGTIPPVGEVLRVKLNNEFVNLTVSGVYSDFPSNSTLYPDFIADIRLSEVVFGQFKTFLGKYSEVLPTEADWDLTAFYTYVVLDKKADKGLVIDKMQRYNDLTKRAKETESALKYGLQPVTDIYLGSEKYTGIRFFRTGNVLDHKYYLSIATLILLISVINYVILTRASAVSRFREIGTRKVFGASAWSLRWQLVVEANIITLLSLVPASFVFDYGLGILNQSMNKNLSGHVFSYPVMWILLILLVLFIGTVSGLLIGNKVSAISPLKLLSGKLAPSVGSGRWDYAFLFVHFTIFIVLSCTVLLITRQIKFSTTSKLGIDPRNILVSELNSDKLKSSFGMFKNEMSKTSGVLSVAGTSLLPMYSPYIPITLANPEGEKVTFEGSVMGEGLPELLGLEISQGSVFGKYHPLPFEVIFNESSAKKYNIKAGDTFLKVFHVLGIVRDFHAHSLHTSINPMVILQQSEDKMGLLVIKTDGKNDKAIVRRLQELYSQADPDEVFDFSFYQNSINSLYDRERSQAKIMGAFSILAIALAIMGLFGMTALSTNRRTKEIGIRKVCGSSISEVTVLLNRGILKWVVASMLLGFPVAVFIILRWRVSFAYQCPVGWWIFILSGTSALLIAALTVNWHILKVSSGNPVNSLRYE